jgi:hypothetical protein
MRTSVIVLVLGSFLVGGCATNSEPKVDAAGLVRVTSWKPGTLYAHPSRSIDDYDNILVGDVDVAYAPKQQPLSEQDMQRLRMKTYQAIVTEIPAAGQLAARGPGPCTVELDVQLASLELPKKGSRGSGETTVILEFRDSRNRDPIVRYEQHRELAIGLSSSDEPDIEGIRSTLEIAANDVRRRLRDALPLNATGARSDQGCKGVIGQVRKQAKQASAQ